MYKKVSIRAEQEQEIVKQSVSIDWDKREASAFLALRADPKDHLRDNRSVAFKRLQSVCKKYGGDDKVVECISAAFEKLLTKGYMSFIDDLSKEEQ